MIRTVGELNVVQVIIDSASNYVRVRKMLEPKYRNIFWTSYAANFVDVMFEDIGKVEQIMNIVEHVKCITKHIDNLSWVLSIMWKNTGARSLLGMPSRDLQLTSSHCNLSLPKNKTHRKYFLVITGMHLGGVIE